MKSNLNRSFPFVFMIVGGILLIIALIWVGMNNLQGGALSSELQTNPARGEIILPEIQRVSLEDAYTAFNDESAVFLDVRSAEAYQAEHISGALSLPEVDLQERYLELDKSRWIITYCT